jgi:hypothetical protein
MSAIIRILRFQLTVFITAITFFGAFSRFTHGQYTPRFYAYQVDRAPDDGSMWMVPYMDVAVASMLLFSRTRTFALFLCVLFQGMGLAMRFQQEKDAAPDLILCTSSVLAFLASYYGN